MESVEDSDLVEAVGFAIEALAHQGVRSVFVGPVRDWVSASFSRLHTVSRDEILWAMTEASRGRLAPLTATFSMRCTSCRCQIPGEYSMISEAKRAYLRSGCAACNEDPEDSDEAVIAHFYLSSFLLRRLEKEDLVKKKSLATFRSIHHALHRHKPKIHQQLQT